MSEMTPGNLYFIIMITPVSLLAVFAFFHPLIYMVAPKVRAWVSKMDEASRNSFNEGFWVDSFLLIPVLSLFWPLTLIIGVIYLMYKCQLVLMKKSTWDWVKRVKSFLKLQIKIIRKDKEV